MEKTPDSMREIAFEAILGMLTITFWYLVLFGLAYSLEIILPEFKWGLLIAPAYFVKYAIMYGDIWLFLNSFYTEIRVNTKKINDYRGQNL